LPKPFELPEVRAVVRATRLSCQNARKAQKFTPVRGSSGESRLIVPVPQSRVPTTNICLATVASGAALDFVDFGGDLACNWLELGEDA